jgi:hypothetical protein
MATRQIAYAASASIAGLTLASLGNSATLVTGAESDLVDNTSNKYLDAILAGKITVGTTPAANTQIEVWVIPSTDGASAWPDVFDGTGSAETVTSRDILAASGRLAAVMTVPVATSNVTYWFAGVSVAALFGGNMPPKWVVFVVHNTNVALNSTGGNHALNYVGITETIA